MNLTSFILSNEGSPVIISGWLAICMGMIILGLLMLFKVSFTMMLILALLIMTGHNLFDFAEAAPDFKGNIWLDIIFRGRFTFYKITDSISILVAYPFLPWTGIMIGGYCLGKLFTPQYSSEQRKNILLRIGAGLLFLFVVLRFINVYGDPEPWAHQRNDFYTFLSFIKVSKYPPSLLFILVTVGITLITLAFLEKIKIPFTSKLIVLGKTAFFYYILHFFFIHLLSAIAFLARGHALSEASNVGGPFPFWFLVPGEGYNLWTVYGIWIFVVVALFPVSKWYDQYKAAHKEKWWLSYL